MLKDRYYIGLMADGHPAIVSDPEAVVYVREDRWMPIETALRPRKSNKDPVDILLWDGIRQAVGHWTDTTETREEFVKETKSGKRIYEWVEHVSGYWDVEGDFLLPTRWMPLPPAPKGSNND